MRKLLTISTLLLAGASLPTLATFRCPNLAQLPNFISSNFTSSSGRCRTLSTTTDESHYIMISGQHDVLYRHGSPINFINSHHLCLGSLGLRDGNPVAWALRGPDTLQVLAHNRSAMRSLRPRELDTLYTGLNSVTYHDKLYNKTWKGRFCAYGPTPSAAPLQTRFFLFVLQRQPFYYRVNCPKLPRKIQADFTGYTESGGTATKVLTLPITPGRDTPHIGVTGDSALPVAVTEFKVTVSAPTGSSSSSTARALRNTYNSARRYLSAHTAPLFEDQQTAGATQCTYPTESGGHITGYYVMPENASPR